MKIIARAVLSERDDVPMWLDWTPDTGYAVTTVTATATGATLGTGAHAIVTVGSRTTFYITSAAIGVAHVQFEITLTPYAKLHREVQLNFV